MLCSLVCVQAQEFADATAAREAQRDSAAAEAAQSACDAFRKNRASRQYHFTWQRYVLLVGLIEACKSCSFRSFFRLDWFLSIVFD